MRRTASFLKLLAHRAVFALVLLAFLVPMPTPTPDDEVRAVYAAQGFLCDPDTPGLHPDTHCVLCLLPAAGAAPEAISCPAPSRLIALAQTASPRPALALAPARTRHARAPPPSLV